MNVSCADTPPQRDWRGLLLVLLALLIYLVGPLGRYLDEKKAFPKAVKWDALVAGMGVDSDCGLDPRRAVFLMQPIDLNRADIEVLASLKGVGPELAARIIADRVRRGGFVRIAAITEVNGIGPGKLAGFADEVMVGRCVE